MLFCQLIVVRELICQFELKKTVQLKKKRKTDLWVWSSSSWKYAEKPHNCNTETKSPEGRVYLYPRRMFQEWNQPRQEKAKYVLRLIFRKCFRTMMLLHLISQPPPLGIWTIYYFILRLVSALYVGCEGREINVSNSVLRQELHWETSTTFDLMMASLLTLSSNHVGQRTLGRGSRSVFDMWERCES